MPFLKISINNITEEQFQILLSDIADTPFNGIEETNDGYFIYYDTQDWNEEYESLMMSYSSEISKDIIEDQNWNASWESQFEPVLIDDFCYIKAPFHEENTSVEHVIHLSPKMSFGTGHHATTKQMIQLMRDMDFAGKRVFDFGTGTGILAVLAEKLGAEYVLGNDIDTWSRDNAQETAEKNGATKTHIVLTDILDIKEEFDIILANINRHILLKYMADMNQLLSTHGFLLLSGIFNVDVEMILESAEQNGFSLLNKSEENNWACLLLQKI